ncbi:HNH endonuclease [Clostridium bowmanii]|uniref:RNA-guided endonuclease IscB n=1 Tax=Clostridium bowmanii TaxID=132925 RepID=UPI001C0C1EE5|nr:RNA-guided endonuclease IscB [Clostridium bowmanii]MBU3188774.1 HNH endonuclease [Clostridium bowmanii]MCA1073358.1 HNH endonuclease [Clostridium bowmanii]
MTEIIKNKEYAFVLDINDKKLSPTNIKNAWFLIRKQKATIIIKYPMVIKLKREILNCELDNSEHIFGHDDGSKYVGISIVQKCKTKNKPTLKGTIILRQNVSALMRVRRHRRAYRRSNKRYRPRRVNNRFNSNKKERISPTIKQKRETILRMIHILSKYINIREYHLEDVVIDIKLLTEGNKLDIGQYQKPNRMNKNLRKATIIRDNYKCMECGKTNCKLQAHHIVPVRLKGADTLENSITLCISCHKKVTGTEELYIDKFQKIIGGKNTRYDYAQHVMQGKTYLRNELSKLGKLVLTTGKDTANKRIKWNIKKSHSNDAIVITNLTINNDDCNIKDWAIKPIRKKSKAIIKEMNGFRHRDLVKYTKKDGSYYIGYIIAFRFKKKECNITTCEGEILRGYSVNRLKLIWSFNKMYWL